MRQRACVLTIINTSAAEIKTRRPPGPNAKTRCTQGGDGTACAQSVSILSSRARSSLWTKTASRTRIERAGSETRSGIVETCFRRVQLAVVCRPDGERRVDNKTNLMRVRRVAVGRCVDCNDVAEGPGTNRSTHDVCARPPCFIEF